MRTLIIAFLAGVTATGAFAQSPEPPMPLQYSIRVADGVALGEVPGIMAALPHGLRQAANAVGNDSQVSVDIGVFDAFPDALLVANDYRDHLPESKIVRTDSQGAAIEPKPYFEKFEVRNPASLKENELYIALEALDVPEIADRYRAELDRRAAQMDPGDPISGYIQVNLGIIDMRAANYDQAMEFFLPVANGEIASVDANRIMAMRRVAWILHNVHKQRLDAYRAYWDVYKFSSSPSVQANCRVELAGLLFELAESEKGSHEDVREFIEESLLLVSEDIVRSRSTLELMYFETYARQFPADYETAATKGLEYIDKYSSLPGHSERDLAAAYYQVGLFLQNCGKTDEAKAVFHYILSSIEPSVEKFKGRSPHAQALLGLAKEARKEGDTTKERELVLRAYREHPEDSSVQRLAAANPYYFK